LETAIDAGGLLALAVNQVLPVGADIGHGHQIHGTVMPVSEPVKEVMQIGQIAFNAGLGQILSGQVLLKTC
jgi:hypothetical protein